MEHYMDKISITKYSNLLVVQVRMLYTTVFWKTDLMITNIEIRFLPVDKCHTHALSRDTMHLRLDGQVYFYRRLFATL